MIQAAFPRRLEVQCSCSNFRDILYPGLQELHKQPLNNTLPTVSRESVLKYSRYELNCVCQESFFIQIIPSGKYGSLSECYDFSSFVKKETHNLSTLVKITCLLEEVSCL